MRIVLGVIALLIAPTVAFFVWAWLVQIKRERKLAGTLPEWQALPWTNLAIAGLVLVIAALLYVYFIAHTSALGGLLGPTR
jgi:drug/metabolite transporter (DMT)-like permease